MKSYTEKNLHIETLRGVAIILVVFGHIIGSGAKGGLKVDDDSVLRYLYYCFEYIRMPLFTIISGFIYAYKPIKDKVNRIPFLKGKVRRLLLPMFIVSSVLFLSRIVIPGTNFTPSIEEWPLLMIFPYDVYWYLYALFLIFLLIAVLDTQLWFHQFKNWLLIFMSAAIVSYFIGKYVIHVPNYFGMFGSIYLLPFFLLGIGFNRYKKLVFTRRNLIYMLSIFTITYIVQQVIWFEHLPLQSRQSLLGFAVGISAAFLLFHFRIKNNFLIYIGGYAYPIYLFHVFFTGGVRIVLHRVSIYNEVTIITLALFFAILIPILMERLFSQFKASRLLLLGLRYHSR